MLSTFHGSEKNRYLNMNFRCQVDSFRESSSRGTTKTAGRSSSLTAPNGPAQQEVILTAWQEAGQAPGGCLYDHMALKRGGSGHNCIGDCTI